MYIFLVAAALTVYVEAIGNDGHWTTRMAAAGLLIHSFVRLAGVLGHPEWAEHPDYSTDAARVRSADGRFWRARPGGWR